MEICLVISLSLCFTVNHCNICHFVRVQMLHTEPILVKLETSAHHRTHNFFLITCLLEIEGLPLKGECEVFISVVTLKASGFWVTKGENVMPFYFLMLPSPE